MLTRRLLTLALLAACAITAQEIKVTGAVKRALTLTAGDLSKLPRAAVKTTSNGLENTYNGVWLDEILNRADIPQGGELRGKALAAYVLATAQDGYQVLFSLAELDPGFIDNEILVADTASGKPRSGVQGHFRLIVPKDKPDARSVRMLTKLAVMQVRK